MNKTHVEMSPDVLEDEAGSLRKHKPNFSARQPRRRVGGPDGIQVKVFVTKSGAHMVGENLVPQVVF